MRIITSTSLLLTHILLICAKPQAPLNDATKSQIEELTKNPQFPQLFAEFLNQVQQQFNTTTTTAPPQNLNVLEQQDISRISNNPFIASTLQQSSPQPPRWSPNTPARQSFVQVPRGTTKPQIRRRPTSVSTTPIPLKTTTPFSNLLVRNFEETPKKIVTKAPVVQATSKFDEEIFRKQAENAKYQFASEVDDSINGQLLQREETRDGLAVKGKYSYNDGFFKRTVHYEADDKGYRVVKEDVEAVGHGPQYNPDGQAKVSQYVSGNNVNYQITNDDIIGNQKLVSDGEKDDVAEELL